MNEPHVETALQAAKLRIQACVSTAAERLSETLGLQPAGTAQVEGRHVYAAAQFDLRRKLADFNRGFADHLREQVREKVAAAVRGRGPSSRSLSTASWETLTLVEEDEVDQRVAAERMSAQLAEQCEWELRELDSYAAALLHGGEPDPARNPLRTDVVAQALRRAIDGVTEDPAGRRGLAPQGGRALAGSMKAC